MTTLSIYPRPAAMRFAMVPETLLQADISYRAFKVAVAIYLHVDRRSGECHPTNSTLADATGIDPRHVRDCLNELDDKGLIRRSGATTRRVIHVPQLGTKTVPSTRDQISPEMEPARDQNGPPGGTKTVPSARDQNGPPTRTDQLDRPENTPPIAGAGGGARETITEEDVRRLCHLAEKKWPMMEVGPKLTSVLPGYPVAWCEYAIQEATGKKLFDPASYIKSTLQKCVRNNGPPEPDPTPPRRSGEPVPYKPAPVVQLTPEQIEAKHRRDAARKCV